MITVIHSRSQEAQVYYDFCQPLRTVDSALPLPAIPTNMLSITELVNAIRGANADVLALIRGGGSEEQFHVFESPELLQACGEKRVYRVVGLGHAGNATALDLLSDFVATTPSAVGAHLAELLRHARDTQQTLASLRAQNDELRVQVRYAQQQAIAPTPVITRTEEWQPMAHGLTTVLIHRGALLLALVIGMLVGVGLFWLVLPAH